MERPERWPFPAPGGFEHHERGALQVLDQVSQTDGIVCKDQDPVRTMAGDVQRGLADVDSKTHVTHDGSPG